MSSSQEIKKIEAFAKDMRKLILKMALAAGAGSSHLGGGLSMVDIVATLYASVLRHKPADPEWRERDRFILSKGHGVLGYYTALALSGYFSVEELVALKKNDGFLFGHPVMNRPKGIEFSTGSLGMGLSLGIGVALSLRRHNLGSRVFVLMGDGECNEGSVWEALMAAPQFKLSHVTAIFDRNGLQQTGTNADIMSLGDLTKKLESFGWEAVEVDGHDVPSLYSQLSRERNSDKPLALVARTVKGKGVAFAENNNDWHHAPLSQAQFDQAWAAFEETPQ